MSKRDWVVDLLVKVVKDKPTANMVLDVLIDAGVLNLDYGDQDIGRIVTAYTETFGTTKVTKYDRFAAQRLAKRYGVQVVYQIILLLGKQRDEPYAPVIASISDLESKWVNVMNFLRKTNQDEGVIDV